MWLGSGRTPSPGRSTGGKKSIVPLSMPRHVVLLDSESEEDPEGPAQPPLDPEVRRQTEMLIEVFDVNCRNLDFPYDLEDERGEGAEIHAVVSRILGDMRFLGPAHGSHRWAQGFRELLNACTDLRIERITEQEKALCRKGGQCVICGTHESNSRFAVHFFCEKSYSAARFSERPEDWPRAFDSYIQALGEETTHEVCLPCGKVSVSSGYKGAFCVGTTCLEKLKKTFAAQNFVFDQMLQSWQEIRSMGEKGFDYQSVPTLGPGRVIEVYTRIDAIRNGRPGLSSSSRLWKEIALELEEASEALGVERLRIAGQLAERSLQEGMEVSNEEEASEEEGQDAPEEEDEDYSEGGDEDCSEGGDEDCSEGEGGDDVPLRSLRRSPRIAQRPGTARNARRPERPQKRPARQSAQPRTRARSSEGVQQQALSSPMQTAGVLRASGLGSRQSVAQALFTLAADLTKSGEMTRAAAASAGGITILELLAKTP